MNGVAVLDWCGFDAALGGVNPGNLVTYEFTQFLLPIGEYRAYLVSLLSDAYAGFRASELGQLIDGAAGPSQPRDLALSALAHPGLPKALHDIEVSLVPMTTEVVVDSLRVGHRFALDRAGAEFVAAAVHLGHDVIACSNRAAVTHHLQCHGLTVFSLSPAHQCHRPVRRPPHATG